MGGRRAQHLLLRRLQADSRAQSDIGADSTAVHGKNVLKVRLIEKPEQYQCNGVHAGVYLGSAGN